MTIRRSQAWTVFLGILVLPMLLWGAPKAASPSIAANQQPAELKQLLIDNLAARDAALKAIDARFRQAPDAERPAIEAEAVQTQLDYERSYLTLLIEYHSITGNEIEQRKAEQMLDALNGTRAEDTATSETAKTATTKPAAASGQEGVIREQ